MKWHDAPVQLPTVTLSLPLLQQFDVEIHIRREDLIHPQISGNKYRKLKYNFLEASASRKRKLLSFGGPHSNHLAALAFAGKEYGFKTMAVVRGKEWANKIDKSPTLIQAAKCGMGFYFVSRTAYRKKHTSEFLKTLPTELREAFVIPEGGANSYGLRGCEEILQPADEDYQFICCPVGTGTTLSGITNCLKPGQQVLGFLAFKATNYEAGFCNFIRSGTWSLIKDFHFGGFGKMNDKLIEFINAFFKETNILLDPVYTGKMMYGLIEMVKREYFKAGSRILVIHTGGLQGIAAANEYLSLKGKKRITN